MQDMRSNEEVVSVECLSAPLRALADAVDLLAAQVAVKLPGAQALAETAVLLRLVQRLQIVQLQRLADVDTRGLYALADAPSTGSWLARQQVELDRSQVALARALRALPLVGEQVAEGSLPLRSAKLIDTALGKVRRYLDRPDGLLDGQPQEQVLQAVIMGGVPDLVAEAMGGLDEDDPRLSGLTTELTRICFEPVSAIARLEAALVVLALHLEPAQLRPALARLVDALLPMRLQERSDRAHADRGLSLMRNPDGSGWFLTDAELDDECGELLWTVLQAQLATDPENPSDTTAAHGRHDEPAEQLYDGTGPRSLRQRRHDALSLGLRRLLDSGALGLRDKAAPHVAVTVGLDALHDLPGALPATGASGQRLPVALVRRWLCDSVLTRFVLGLGRRVVESSHTERTLKPHERRVKRVETGGICQAAGCPPRPDRPLVPHHAIPWSHCHTTSINDTVLLCEKSHHDLHTGGRTLTLRDGRRLNATGWLPPPEPGRESPSWE